jgi:hypothetical protein
VFGFRHAVSVALALEFTFALAPVAADISAPDGRRWIRDLGTIVENVDEFPDYVLVAYPCRSAVTFSIDDYCIAKKGEILLGDNLYAIPKKAIELREISEKNGVALGGSVVVIDKPSIDVASEFFTKDKRVIRPGFDLRGKLFGTSVQNDGVVGARYVARIESVGRDGVKGKYVRAKFECKSGTKVEVDWGATEDEPPVPRCPVTDDRGELRAVSETNARGDAAIVPLRRPPTKARTIWLGILIASLGLIGMGALFGKRPPAH